MQQVLTQILLSLLPAVIISLITSFFTVRFSLNRFYSERWWERKAQAYGAIVEALYHMHRYVQDLFCSEQTDRESAPQTKELLRQRWTDGYEEISKAAAIGAFIISEEAVTALGGLLEELGRARQARTLFEHLDSELAALSKCLNALRDCAKKDLKVK